MKKNDQDVYPMKDFSVVPEENPEELIFHDIVRNVSCNAGAYFDNQKGFFA
jgi:hypothetical protein